MLPFYRFFDGEPLDVRGLQGLDVLVQNGDGTEEWVHVFFVGFPTKEWWDRHPRDPQVVYSTRCGKRWAERWSTFSKQIRAAARAAN